MTLHKALATGKWSSIGESVGSHVGTGTGVPGGLGMKQPSGQTRRNERMQRIKQKEHRAILDIPSIRNFYTMFRFIAKSLTLIWEKQTGVYKQNNS